jgi:hypothetical protein
VSSRNVIERVLLLEADDEILASHLPPEILGRSFADGRRGRELRSVSDQDVVRPLADLERMAIEHALKVCEGNKTRAARQLGISRQTCGPSSTSTRWATTRRSPRKSRTGQEAIDGDGSGGTRLGGQIAFGRVARTTTSRVRPPRSIAMRPAGAPIATLNPSKDATCVLADRLLQHFRG